MAVDIDTRRDSSQRILSITDRGAAIAKAIGLAGSGDLVLIAGRGHETYQAIGDALVPFEVSPMRRKELAIFNVRRSLHESEAALQLLVERTAWFAPLVTHTRPISRIAEAFSIAA